MTNSVDLKTSSMSSQKSDQKSNSIVKVNSNKMTTIKIPPKDQYNQTLYYFFLLGLSTYVPWFFFMNAQTYWDYKFRDVTFDNNKENKNTTIQSKLQIYYTAYLHVAAGVPFVLVVIVNIFICKWISTKIRLITTQFFVIILFIITTIFIEINTDDWQFKFLIITLTTVAGLNAFSSTYTGTLYAVVGHFSPKYISSMTQGQAVSGVIAAIFQILSLWLSTGPIATGLIYFLIGDFIIIFAFISHLFLEKQGFFKYHMKEKLTIRNSDKSVDDTPSSGDNNSVSFMKIIIKIWPYGLSVFLTSFLTHLIYPAVTSHIKSEAPSNTEWSNKYFKSVATFFLYSVGDYFGCFLSRYSSWLKGKTWLLLALTIARVIFLPIFLVCNASSYPNKYSPIYITNDFIYMALMILFSTTSGYMWSVICVLVPTVVESKEQEIASTIIGGFLGLGYSVSAVLSIYFLTLL